MRKKIKLLFMESFRNLSFSKEQEIKVLDVGCGLGFISCACAEFYPNALVSGFDTFEDDSLRGSSLAKARKNAEILGFSDRVRFRKGDVFGSNFRRSKFDLIVSNLVFHNFGEKRFDAYARLASWTYPNTYALLGDLMFELASDLKCLSKLFRNVTVVPAKGVGFTYKVLLLSGPK